MQNVLRSEGPSRRPDAATTTDAATMLDANRVAEAAIRHAVAFGMAPERSRLTWRLTRINDLREAAARKRD